MDGFLNVLKSPGMTSHDVVNWVRRLVGEKRVGHTGTLDPDVPGVLAVGIGQAVRLNEYLLDADKAYRAEITFGISTDSGDASGVVTGDQPAPQISRSELATALASFIGDCDQIPPMISAVQVKGQRLYDIARAGGEVERKPKRVRIQSLDLLKFWAGDYPRALFDITCSKGTYVRTLCEDIGRRLGVGAHMSYLVRTRSGPFALADAEPLTVMADDVGKYLLPMAAAIPGVPCLTLAADRVPQVFSGILPETSWFDAEPLPERAGLCSPDGRLIALVERDTRRDRPYRYLKVFGRGE